MVSKSPYKLSPRLNLFGLRLVFRLPAGKRNSEVIPMAKRDESRVFTAQEPNNAGYPNHLHMTGQIMSSRLIAVVNVARHGFQIPL